MWTLHEGVDLCRLLNTHLAPVGYCVALTGSVLLKGKSYNDVDLVVYPLNTQKIDLDILRGALRLFGIKPWVSVEQVTDAWRKKGSDDTKHVEVWRSGVRRIDLFILQ